MVAIIIKPAPSCASVVHDTYALQRERAFSLNRVVVEVEGGVATVVKNNLGGLLDRGLEEALLEVARRLAGRVA